MRDISRYCMTGKPVDVRDLTLNLKHPALVDPRLPSAAFDREFEEARWNAARPM